MPSATPRSSAWRRRRRSRRPCPTGCAARRSGRAPVTRLTSRGIRDLLERDRAGVPAVVEHLEAGAGVAERPRGELDAPGARAGRLDVGGEGAHDASLSVVGRCRMRVGVERGELVFEVEDLGEARWRPGRGGRRGRRRSRPISASHRAATADAARYGLRGDVVVGLVVADEPSALAEEERVVAPAGRLRSRRASRARRRRGARGTRRAARVRPGAGSRRVRGARRRGRWSRSSSSSVSLVNESFQV